MDSFPLFFKLKNVPCLVVGGGEIARHKAAMLLKAGAQITLIAPELHPSTQELLHTHPSMQWKRRHFVDQDVEGVRLVIAATDDEAINARISFLAQKIHIPINAVDQPDLSTVIFPSVIDRSPLVIAIGSDGNAPVLVRLLRARLESMIPAIYGKLAGLVGKWRHRVRERYPDVVMRRRFWDHHLQGEAAELVFSGREQEAEAILEAALEKGESKVGEVYLVGGGPGDPDLLTFKALRLMQQADVVLYDRLVSKEVLELCRREAERIYVGKDRNPYSITQDNINETLVRLAQEGKRVLRLKGGDPYIFGRGGEEVSFLFDRQIRFQVVPGITAASGCAAYAGIPLTHRDYAQSVRFITGHRQNGEFNFDWKEFVQPGQTLVFYMGLNGLEEICEKLIDYGMKPDMPAALIEKGTSHRQRVIVGTLLELPEKVRVAEMEAPTLIIIGEVVRLREKLNWFR